MEVNRGGGVQTGFSFFYSIVRHGSTQHRTPAPSTERQHPEAWPTSIYRHLRESDELGVSVIKALSFFAHIILFLK